MSLDKVTFFIIFCALLFTLSLYADAIAQQQLQHEAVEEDLSDVGIEEKLGDEVSRDTWFFNEEGERVEIGDYLDNGKPIMLALVYYECPRICNLILQGMKEGLSELSWTPGDEFEIVTVSIAPDETPELASQQKRGYIDQIDDPEAGEGWHFLTGDKDQIDKLADEVGYGYKWSESTQEYVHGSALIFLSDEGVITRYLHGLDYTDIALRNSLYDAADGNIGSALDRVVLYCYEYDENTGTYAPVAVNIMKIGGVFTLLVLGAFLGIFWYREKRTRKS